MTADEIEAERERFEAWVKDYWVVYFDRDEFEEDKYADAELQDSWECWKERAEIARAEQAELRERVRELKQQLATMRASGFVATASTGDSGATFREFPIIIQERSW